MSIERCKNPWNHDCRNRDVEVYIMYHDRKLPICKKCWNKISKSNLEWVGQTTLRMPME